MRHHLLKASVILPPWSFPGLWRAFFRKHRADTQHPPAVWQRMKLARVRTDVHQSAAAAKHPTTAAFNGRSFFFQKKKNWHGATLST
jgi:hypothetical protein